LDYNATHGITPQSVKRAVQQSLHTHEKELEHADKLNASLVADGEASYDKLRVIAELEDDMREASSRLEFERAAHLRDQILALKNHSPSASPTPPHPVRYPKGRAGKRKK
jgi:excinuclease ABC subunit B